MRASLVHYVCVCLDRKLEAERVIANSHRPTQCSSKFKLCHVGWYEQVNYFECVETPADCRRFNSHRQT